MNGTIRTPPHARSRVDTGARCIATKNSMLRVSPTRVAPVERREFRDLDLFRQELGKCVNRLFEHEYGVPAATSAP